MTWSNSDSRFSDRAHAAMARDVYPQWFPGVELRDVTGLEKDLDYAIDRMLAVRLPPDCHGTAALSVQERFRRPVKPKYWGDLTITELTEWKGEPGELNKLGAQLFVYGYYEEVRDRISAAWVVNIPTIMFGILFEELPFTHQAKNEFPHQSFICLKLDEMRDLGAVMREYPARLRSAREAS